MKILIGIPCYQDVASETLEDYMRFAFYCGRRSEHDFMIAIKSKSEQFRARNDIVTGALQTGCDYLMFLDDDHVIDWETTPGPNSRYGMIQTFLDHFEEDPELGIVGALYYSRGSECNPVLMREAENGGYHWLKDYDITGQLQEVSVQGGGCMMLRMSMFDKIQSPWFEPEFDLGTDLPICKKTRDAGFKVACDTSIKIGHVLSTREVVTPQNRERIALENGVIATGGDSGMDSKWEQNTALSLYRMDAEEYLGMKWEEISVLADTYSFDDFDKYKDKRDYYAAKGQEQLARQVAIHHMTSQQDEMKYFHTLINTNADGSYGADFGCGSAPVGFEFAMKGHKMDFIDIDESGAYEFTKWRAKKRDIDCGWELKGPYDYVLMLDVIEHLEDWKGVLTSVIDSLGDGGGIATNYFKNRDFANPEHISMNHDAVRTFLFEKDIYPVNEFLWLKRVMEKEEVA